MSMFETIQAYKDKDPSINSSLEVLIMPGLWATGFYRVAHFVNNLKLHFIARLISNVGRFFTGVEIHPAAKIGKRIVIDHGMGIVIGGTSVIGDDVLIYHGVTLGATRLSNSKRHPTIENNVIIGANAILLGDITIRKNSTIAAGAIVLSDVDEAMTVVGVYKRK